MKATALKRGFYEAASGYIQTTGIIKMAAYCSFIGYLSLPLPYPLGNVFISLKRPYLGVYGQGEA